ncbi:MAG: hypothetical protein AB1749_13710 [Pseudomonadota bacterium]
MHQKRPGLSPVLWRGHQWVVTADGIETIAAPAYIVLPRHQLALVADDLSGYKCVLDLLDLPWLDASDLWEAWQQAMIWHSDCFASIPEVWRQFIAQRTKQQLPTSAPSSQRRQPNAA